MASTIGSFYLIRQSLLDFDTGSVSVAVENLQVNDRINFPSIGVCEIGFDNDKDVNDKLENIVKRFAN